jgi:hypothetical protein
MCCTGNCCKVFCLNCCLAMCFFQLFLCFLILFLFIFFQNQTYRIDPVPVFLSWMSAVLLGWVTAVPKAMLLFWYDPVEGTRDMNRYSRQYEGYAQWKDDVVQPYDGSVQAVTAPPATPTTASDSYTLLHDEPPASTSSASNNNAVAGASNSAV